jgi:DNA-binding transcriptional ArsR family regulator
MPVNTKEESNRQVPKSQDYLANKQYHDILYGYLQFISDVWNTNDPSVKRRIIHKKDINFSKLGEHFGLSRQTVSTKFKNLMDMGLIEQVDKDTYELTRLSQIDGFLIPYKTLKVLCDTLNEKSISVYTYLYNRYYANGKEPFKFTLAQVKANVGISDKTRSNDDIVTNILFILQKLGLLKYSLTALEQSDNFQNIKTIYQIDWMTTELC